MTDTPAISLTLEQLEHLESLGWLNLQIDSIWPELRNKALELESQQKFTEAQIALNKSNTSIRNDKTLWIEPESADTIEQKFLNLIHNIQDQLKQHFRISLNNFETHYAIYPSGHFYKRHSDQKQMDNKRQFSFVYYLNSDWKPQYGGQLIGYVKQTNQNLFQISPHAGTLILFKSDIEHEVLTSHSSRYSVTGWMRTP